MTEREHPGEAEHTETEDTAGVEPVAVTERNGVRMEVPKHGKGALMRGAPAHQLRNIPRPGALPGLIRHDLRDNYHKRLSFLNDVVDGKAMQRISFTINELAPYVVCSNCGEEGQIQGASRDGLDLGRIEIDLPASASVKDRIAAMDQMGKYGIGQLREISVETVREKVGATIALARARLDKEQLTAFLDGLRVIWA